MFSLPRDLADKRLTVSYIVHETVFSVIYLAAKMCPSLLIEGPPGCGKTELADLAPTEVGFPMSEFSALKKVEPDESDSPRCSCIQDATSIS